MSRFGNRQDTVSLVLVRAMVIDKDYYILPVRYLFTMHSLVVVWAVSFDIYSRRSVPLAPRLSPAGCSELERHLSR